MGLTSFPMQKADCFISCKKCKGDKTVKEKTRQEIFIEKGMPDGYRIVLTGAGDQQVKAIVRIRIGN